MPFTFDGMMGKVIGLVFALVGIIIVFEVGAAVVPDVILAIGDIVNELNTGTVNDTTGDAVLGVAGLIVAVIAVLGLLFLLIRAAGLGAGDGNGRG